MHFMPFKRCISL